MDWTGLLIGIAFLVGAYLFYRLCKWAWPSDPLYEYSKFAVHFRDWIIITMIVIVGLVYIIKSL